MSRPPSSSSLKGKTLTVGKFFADHGAGLGMELLGDTTGLDRPIPEPTINRPGLALAGFFAILPPSASRSQGMPN